uniref:Uncharacterized protein n=1 Tax=Panagrolaimus sp. ES5 TaxID=591445 RepID=A0AC34GTM9_9BILA
MDPSVSSSTDQENTDNESSDICLSALYDAREDSDEEEFSGYAPLFDRSFCTPSFGSRTSSSSFGPSSFSSADPDPYYPEWKFQLPKVGFGLNRPWLPKDDNALSSLSECSDSTQSDHDDDNFVEVPARDYSNVTVNENFGRDKVLEKQLSILQKDFHYYWSFVSKYQKERLLIIKNLMKQLRKPKYFNEEQCYRLNVMINLLEVDLNLIVPILPVQKATFIAETDKKVLIKNGFIYEKVNPYKNSYECMFYGGPPWCKSFVVLNNTNEIMEGTFSSHSHPAAEECTFDAPLPPAPPTTLIRVTSEEDGRIRGNYRKMMKLLQKTSDDFKKWKLEAEFFRIKSEKIYKLVAEVKQLSTTTNMIEMENYLQSIRLDAITVERK